MDIDINHFRQHSGAVGGTEHKHVLSSVVLAWWDGHSNWPEKRRMYEREGWIVGLLFRVIFFYCP
jgi:hypothetical protein